MVHFYHGLARKKHVSVSVSLCPSERGNTFDRPIHLLRSHYQRPPWLTPLPTSSKQQFQKNSPNHAKNIPKTLTKSRNICRNQNQIWSKQFKTHILSYRRSPPSPTARTYRSQRQFPGVERCARGRRRRRRAGAGGAGHGGRLRRQRHGARRGRGVGVGAPGLLLGTKWESNHMGLYYIISYHRLYIYIGITI